MINALNSKIISGTLEGLTVRTYFEKLLTTLWSKGELFSGKKPFGNSDWDWDVISSLIKCGYIPGEINRDDNGEIYDIVFDRTDANKRVINLIMYMCIL